MSVCRFHCWLVFVFYECLSVPPLVCVCFIWVSVSSTVGLSLFSMSVCRFHCWLVFALKTKTNQQWNRQTLIENKNKPTVELTNTHRKQTQTNSGSWFVFVFYECLSVPLLVCFCFLWVSIGSTVGLCLFSMSVCRFHCWLVFVFYECLSVPTLVCFCFLWVSDTHIKQTQTNGGTDRHS
jgi:hypothetical protein